MIMAPAEASCRGDVQPRQSALRHHRGERLSPVRACGPPPPGPGGKAGGGAAMGGHEVWFVSEKYAPVVEQCREAWVNEVTVNGGTGACVSLPAQCAAVSPPYKTITANPPRGFGISKSACPTGRLGRTFSEELFAPS